jgi:hypothetical protein
MRNASKAKTAPARRRHLENGTACIQAAVDVLFDALASQYWQQIRTRRQDAHLFSALSPRIGLEVERLISLSKLAAAIREKTQEKVAEWTDRTAFEATVSDSSLWRKFRDQFADLASAEQGSLERDKNAHPLTAYVDYTVESGEAGYWILSEGPSPDLRADFDALATRAGITLKPPDGTAPIAGFTAFFWIYQ